MTSSQVNQAVPGPELERERAAAEPDREPPAAADGVASIEPRPAAESEQGRPAPRAERVDPPLEGSLRKERSGAARVLMIVTGIALVRWLLRGLGALLGYRARARLTLQAGGLELDGERSFLGIGLGRARELIALAALRRVRVAADSALWAVLAALAVLVAAAAVGTVLALWGVAGREPSWLALAGGVVMAGLALDAAAFLWVRRSVARGRVRLEIQLAGRRYLLGPLPERPAHRLLDRLREGGISR
jgi:hypothetical protein